MELHDTFILKEIISIVFLVYDTSSIQKDPTPEHRKKYLKVFSDFFFQQGLPILNQKFYVTKRKKKMNASIVGNFQSELSLNPE